MTDYRTFLSALVAVFLALGLGMLIGGALIRVPSPQQQQQELRELQQTFTEFSERYAELRGQSDSLRDRLKRSDDAFKETMARHILGRMPGWRIAVIVCGEMNEDDTLKDLDTALAKAGATRVSTTRVSDTWVPPDEESRRRLVAALGLSQGQSRDDDLAFAVGRAVALSRWAVLKAAADAATGLRLEGDYSARPQAVLLISGTETEERHDLARAGQTPEAGILSGVRDAGIRAVASETDGEDDLSSVGYWARYVPATVDNIDMASGRLSAILALAGADGHFGLRRGAERPIPEIE